MLKIFQLRGRPWTDKTIKKIFIHCSIEHLAGAGASETTQEPPLHSVGRRTMIFQHFGRLAIS